MLLLSLYLYYPLTYSLHDVKLLDTFLHSITKNLLRSYLTKSFYLSRKSYDDKYSCTMHRVPISSGIHMEENRELKNVSTSHRNT